MCVEILNQSYGQAISQSFIDNWPGRKNKIYFLSDDMGPVVMSVKVDGAAVAALIGVRGTKVKDIEEISGCKIKFPKERIEVVRVSIHGYSVKDVERAKNILLLGYDHFKCSIETSPDDPMEEVGLDEIIMDIHCVFSEVHELKT